GVDVVEADPDLESATAAVDAVPAQPRAEHVPLLLHAVERVDTRGLQVRAGVVAPHIVGAGEGDAVLATTPDAATGRVLHRERRAGAGGRDGHTGVVEAVARTLADHVVRIEFGAGQ